MKNTMPSSVSTVATSSASPSLGRRLTALFLALTLTTQTLPAFAGVYYIHSDHLNTPRAVTNPQNQVIWQNLPLTEPFGSSAPDEDPDNDGQTFTLNLRFPGQYFDQETNSNYNYYRDHYFPGLGRYGQSDPIGLYGGINTYAYVNGNPLIYVDPEGLLPPMIVGCIAVSVGYGAATGAGNFLLMLENARATSEIRRFADKMQEFCNKGNANACDLAVKWDKEVMKGIRTTAGYGNQLLQNVYENVPLPVSDPW
jgi:RHS repeat-associated protein